MNKAEFIRRLEISLSDSVSSAIIAENVKYYNEYIENEKNNRRQSEEEVIEEIGDPRLIAKSIINANVEATREENKTYDDIGEDTKEEKKWLPTWLFPLSIGIIILILVGWLFFAALPYIIVIFIVYQLIKFVIKLTK